MAITLRQKDEKEAKKRGLITGAALATSIGIGVVTAAPLLTVLGLIPTAYLAYDWFKYRAKRGIRF